MADNFTNLMKNTILQIQDTQQIAKRISTKVAILWQTVKAKEANLVSSSRKTTNYI